MAFQTSFASEIQLPRKHENLLHVVPLPAVVFHFVSKSCPKINMTQIKTGLLSAVPLITTVILIGCNHSQLTKECAQLLKHAQNAASILCLFS